MRYSTFFYDSDEDGNDIQYTVDFSVTPTSRGDHYQPPSGGEIRDIRVLKNNELMWADDVNDELDKMIDEAIEKEIERHN